MNARRLTATALCAATVLVGLGGCRTKGEIVVDESVGITAVRSRCPAVGIPDYTGDVTLFRTPGDKTADNIDLVAVMTNVRTQCNDSGEKVAATVSFDVLARRNDTREARQVTLPYFVTVLQGGSTVTSKRVGRVTIDFAAGQDRAQGHAQGVGYIDRAAATLPAEVRDRIMRKRKAGDSDAAIDPLSEPDVKAAVARATFELLVGFQLDDGQLAYNVTR
ncbi:hypothetical protein [Novosphingobium album (ex Liu et al. 2023)]|uniref:Uncharacterized protein n=1 Tax=Novosphingobium album (ex Liu et al. 2023) TaxID=3031130 RepID=A0ABT5WRC2_9SPHN|nr:hypothetical protein [Novosphingobium album (ex Liu et al. 2023)]MDE8652600.1 hypothetical protein [Novosphingobium album (ex Liu et al. 2023)]